jgi:hypothetical protein
VIGNNRTGRNGKLRCIACRKIHSKVHVVVVNQSTDIQCIFVSEEIRCDHCSQRNLECIKVLGPKKAGAKAGVPGALPSPDNAIINPEDSLLFQYAYSDKVHNVRKGMNQLRLIRKFRAGYGGYIPSAWLRHAILALAARYLPSAEFRTQRIQHVQKASSTLM